MDFGIKKRDALHKGGKTRPLLVFCVIWLFISGREIGVVMGFPL
jgi:hypothetical protein